jgi:inner membrane protein
MAALGHIAVGVAAGRLATGTPGWKPALAFSALSLLPDLDVIAFRFGIPYAAPLGHRGATHSFAFAALVGLLAWVLFKHRRLALLAGLVVASHPLLDALTDGGLGVALLWPLEGARYFAPWRPLPVAPIGLGMLSPRGLFVVATEAIAFAPLWFYAWWPRRRSAPAVPE